MNSKASQSCDELSKSVYTYTIWKLTAFSAGSGCDHHFIFSAIIMHYLWTLLYHLPSGLLLLKGKYMTFSNCTKICANSMHPWQAPTLLHKCRLRRTEKVPLPSYAQNETGFIESGMLDQQAASSLIPKASCNNEDQTRTEFSLQDLPHWSWTASKTMAKWEKPRGQKLAWGEWRYRHNTTDGTCSAKWSYVPPEAMVSSDPEGVLFIVA